MSSQSEETDTERRGATAKTAFFRNEASWDEVLVEATEQDRYGGEARRMLKRACTVLGISATPLTCLSPVKLFPANVTRFVGQNHTTTFPFRFTAPLFITRPLFTIS